MDRQYYLLDDEGKEWGPFSEGDREEMDGHVRPGIVLRWVEARDLDNSVTDVA